MKILSVRKEKQSYVVQFDNEEKLIVSEDFLVSRRLLKGEEISKETFADLKKESTISWGIQLAYAYLDRCLRTEKEVADYLKLQGIEDKFLKIILEKLRVLQLVDDQNYANCYVREKVRLCEGGPQKIQQHLLKKGIAKERINQALQIEFPENLQRENARKLAEKLAKKYQKKSYQECLLKVQQGLMMKGFSFELAKESIGTLSLELNEEEEWEHLRKEGEKICRCFSNWSDISVQQKLKQRLYRKGFALDQIEEFLGEFVENHEE